MKRWSIGHGKLAILLCAGAAWGCGKEECRPAPEPAEVQVEVIRFEELLAQAASVEEMEQLLADHPAITATYYQATTPSQVKQVAQANWGLYHNASFDTLLQETRQRYADGWLQDQLQASFGRLKALYPDFEPPLVYTTVSGFSMGSELFFSDSVVVASIDYFTGPEATFQPSPPQGYSYLASKYRAEKLVPQILLRFADDYDGTDPADQTILGEMVSYGKTYFLTSRLLPCTHDTVLLDYSAEQLAGIYYNNEVIWSHFTENELLYETSHELKARYLRERPFTAELGEKAAPRLGQWLGYEIVRQYESRTEKSVQDIMAQPNARQLFLDSEFRPITDW